MNTNLIVRQIPLLSGTQQPSSDSDRIYCPPTVYLRCHRHIDQSHEAIVLRC